MTTTHMVALRIIAPVDRNGNGRRGWLVWYADSGDLAAFVDEGCTGRSVLRRAFPACVDLGEMRVSAAEYNTHKRAEYAR